MIELDVLVPPSQEAVDSFNEALDQGIRFTFGLEAEAPSHQSILNSKGKMTLQVKTDYMNLDDCKTYEDVIAKREAIIKNLNVHTADIYKIMIVDLVEHYQKAHSQ